MSTLFMPYIGVARLLHGAAKEDQRREGGRSEPKQARCLGERSPSYAYDAIQCLIKNDSILKSQIYMLRKYYE